jgi:hypothetical protein
MRASVDPHLASGSSVGYAFANAKRYTGYSEFEDSSRPEKRQRLHVDPDRPLPSSEREASQNTGQIPPKIELDSTVIPNSQRTEVDKAKSNYANNRPPVEPVLPNGVSEAPRDDVSSTGSDVKRRKERSKLITKRNASRFKTPAKRHRSGSTSVTTPSSAIQELSENTPLNKKLKRPSIELNNGTPKAIANKTLPRADVYDVVETDYEEPMVRPKRPISATKSNASFSSLGINESKWRLSSLCTLGKQIGATDKMTVTPNSNTSERSVFQNPEYSLGARHTNGKYDKQQIKGLPPGSASTLNISDEKSVEREKIGSKFQNQQGAGHLAKEKDGLAAEKPSLKLAEERAEAEREEAGKQGTETRGVKGIGAKIRIEAERNTHWEADRRGTELVEPPADDSGILASWRKGSAAKNSLGMRKATCAPCTPRARSPVYSLAPQPTPQVIPNSSPLSARDMSPDVQGTLPKSAKRSVSFASTVPPTAWRSISTTGSGSAGLRQATPTTPRPSFTDAKTPLRRVSPKPSSNRSSISKTSKSVCITHLLCITWLLLATSLTELCLASRRFWGQSSYFHR